MLPVRVWMVPGRLLRVGTMLGRTVRGSGRRTGDEARRSLIEAPRIGLHGRRRRVRRKATVRHVQLSVLWSLGALLLLTISGTMLADFARRMLTSDPDGLSIFTVAAQVFLGLAATSTFTDAGSRYLERFLERFSRLGLNTAQLRFALALAVFGLIALVWETVPERLGGYYNDKGHGAQFAVRPDNDGAIRNYQRAIALNPTLNLPYVNLGGLLEGLYRYEEAAEQYRKAILYTRADPTPYSRLAHVLILDDKNGAALQVTSDALQMKPEGLKVGQQAAFAKAMRAVEKNQAWAEYGLGLYGAAIEDANKSDTAAADCVLGRTYAKLGQKDEERKAWMRFGEKASQEALNDPIAPAIEPDCRALAHQALTEEQKPKEKTHAEK